MAVNTMTPAPHKILDIVKETGLEYTFRVEAKGGAPRHGQFYQVSLPKIGEAPISVSDYYDGYIEFTIRNVGKVTGDVFKLKKGDNLVLRGPYGNVFPTDEFDGKNLVVIAGGTGVSPVRSLLKHYNRSPGLLKKLYFIAGFKNKESVLFIEDLNSFKQNPEFCTHFTLDAEEAPGFKMGFCTQCIADIPFKDFGGDYNVVVVGPPAMMKIAGAECVKQGAAENKIWMSFERKMSCALGKCGHCKINETYVCLEGPVFNYTVAKAMVD